ncbi:MAG: alpha/beta hydrolase [Cytophagales bacterium]|nr:MAG: alpha/beta hydrolase [Cytophagales bacterium]
MDKSLLSYHIQGTGSTVVFLHGFCEDKSIWEAFSNYLSSQYQVISIDLPGFGASPNSNEFNSIPSIAHQIKILLDALKIYSCILVGHSLGGYVALEFAESYPDNTHGLCLFHSTAFADSDEKKNNRNKAIEFIKKNGTYPFIKNLLPSLFSMANQEKYKNEISDLIEKAKQILPETLIRTSEAMRDRADKIEFIKKYPHPILYIVGKEDQAIPLESSIAQIHLAQQAHTLFLSNISHMGMLEAHEQTVHTLEAFLFICNKLQ